MNKAQSVLFYKGGKHSNYSNIDKNDKYFDWFEMSFTVINSSPCILVLSWMVAETDQKRRNCWIKLFLFSFGHKKYSRSFITLRFNHWCHMGYFNDVHTKFLSLEHVSCFAVYPGSESSWISSKILYLNLCSEDEQRSYGFGTTWGWVINDRNFIFGWIVLM